MTYLFTTLIDLPNPTNFLASTTDWSSPIFNALTPLLFLAVGLAVGIGVVVAIMHWFGGIFKR